SSIAEVYAESARDYQTIRELAENAREGAITALAATLPAGTDLLAANTISFGGQRFGLLQGQLQEGHYVADSEGRALSTQPVEGGTLIEFPNLAPYSVTGLSEVMGSVATPDSRVSVIQTNGLTLLENHLMRVEINAAGDITRIYDKEVEREVLPPDS